MRCAFHGRLGVQCVRDARRDSNFCVVHQPPAPPPGRVVRESGGLVLPLMQVVGATIGLFALLVLVAPLFRPPVHTSARVTCPPISEHETRLLFVNADSNGTVNVACGPAVSGSGRQVRP